VLPGFDLARLDELMPHPVYAWMSWVQILSPTPARYDPLRPLLAQSLDFARENGTVASRCDTSVDVGRRVQPDVPSECRE
jgi:Family of unknown function (DUF6194)